jgi:hypothetical protein
VSAPQAAMSEAVVKSSWQEHAKLISAAWQKGVESILETAECLCRAKAELLNIPEHASHGFLLCRRTQFEFEKSFTMSLHEVEQHHSRAERDRALDDQRVMTILQWAEVNGFSVWTGRRMIRAGKGPKILQLSPRRIGITVAANRAWQQARERA